MKLSECKIGTLVCVKADELPEFRSEMVGYVVDFVYPNLSLDKYRPFHFSYRERKGVIFPVVRFIPSEQPTIIDFEIIEPFTAY